MSARKRERGTSIPETAMVLSSLLAMLFGIIDFGRATYLYGFVAQLAREGARWVIVRGSQCSYLDHCNASESDIQAYVQSLSQGVTNASAIAATATWSCPPGSSNNAPGCTVTVSVTYPLSYLLLYMPVSQLPTTISSTSQMVVSQ